VSEISSEIARELVLLIDRKHRSEARRRGERLVLTPDLAERLISYRQSWLATLSDAGGITDEVTFDEVMRKLLAHVEVDAERARALRTVKWREIRAARGGAA
jgi:hypothetical protein